MAKSKSGLLVLVTALLLTAAFSDTAVAEKAYTVPVSDNLVVLEIQFRDNAGAATVLIQEGGLIRIADSKESTSLFGLVPMIGLDGAIQVSLFEIKVLSPSNEGMRQVDSVTIAPNGAVVSSKVPMRIKLLRVEPPNGQSHVPGPDCCVQCSGFWACANYVACEGGGCCCDQGYCHNPKTEPQYPC